MSKVTFKYQCGLMAKDKISGYTGMIVTHAQGLNGMLRYTLQTEMKYTGPIPDAYEFDEQDIVILDKKKKIKTVTHKFKFETGVRVENMINGFTGIITHREFSINGCERYRVETKIGDDGKERINMGFVQEWKQLDEGLNADPKNPVQRGKVGCAASKAARY